MAEKLRKLNLDHLSKLKELGLNPKLEQDRRDLNLILSDAEGRTAELPFSREETLYKNQKGYTPTSTLLPKEWRNKGIATEAYKAIENITGLPIFPDDEQTPSGYALHDKKGYGKEFGLSEKDLDAKLMPSEKMERNARKKVLGDLLNSAASEIDGGAKYDDVQWGLLSQLNNLLPNKEKTNIFTVARNSVLDAEKNRGAESISDYIRNNIPRYASKIKSISPTLLKGLGTAAGGAASLAAEASDAEDLGNAPEQAAMLREIDQANREKKMLGMVPEQNKATVEKELEDQRLGLRRSAIEDLLRK